MFKLIFGLLITTGLHAADVTNIFVQSQSTQLRKDPLATSASLMDLKRGDELILLKKEGMWLQVKTSNQTEGWVPKILTSTVKPLGQAQLLKDTANIDTNAKTSRRRTTDYAVSAATRGLSAGERHRPGDENFRSNRNAVEELEKVQITPQQIKNFKAEAKLEGQ